jgi:hypothetical protein
MSPASFPVLSESLAPEEGGWPSIIAGSKGQVALAAGADSLDCRQRSFSCRASYSLEVFLKYPVRSSGKVACCDQTLPMSPAAHGIAQADDRKNLTIHSASSCCEIGFRDCSDLFGQRGPDICLGKAVDWLSTSTSLPSGPNNFLRIPTTLQSSSTGVAFAPSRFTVVLTTSVSSVYSVTGSTFLTLTFLEYWVSPTIFVPSAFLSISVPSASPVTPLLSSSTGILVQSTFPTIQVTFVPPTSPAFPEKSVNIEFLNLVSSIKIIAISEYSNNFRFLPYHTISVHTSYPIIFVSLSIPLSAAYKVSLPFPASSIIISNYLFAKSQSFQSSPGKDVLLVFSTNRVCTSIAGSYDIVCFITMDRREDDMCVRMEWLAADFLIPKASECPEQPPLDTPELCGGAPVSGNGLQSISNWTIHANELCRHPLGRPGLNRKLHFGNGLEIIFSGSCTSDSFTIMICKIWWTARVTGSASIEDMVQRFMNRVNYDSILFVECARTQLVKVLDRFGNREIFDDSTAQLVAEMQVLAPPALPLFERSPIYADTRLFKELLSGTLNTEFRSAFLDIPEIIKMPDIFARHTLSGYISQTDNRPDDNFIKLVSKNGPLTLALKKAIYGTYNDLVNYTYLVDPIIDDLEQMPKILTISAWTDKMDALKQKFRNVAITYKPDGTLSIDSLRGQQRLPDGISNILSKQIFQRRREHLTWFALYPELKTDFLELKVSSVKKIFDQISSEFSKFSVLTGNVNADQKNSDMLDRYVSISQDGFSALGNWLILSAAHLPNVLHPSRILQLWDIISVSSIDNDIKGAVDPLIPGDIYCVNRTDLMPYSVVYTLSHENSHAFHLSLMDLSRMGSQLATWLLGQIRDMLGAEVHDLGDMFIWTAGKSKTIIAEDFASRFSGAFGTRLTGLIGAIDREAWTNVDLPMVGVAEKPNPEFDDFIASLIRVGLET